jgi:hypothetical protein
MQRVSAYVHKQIIKAGHLRLLYDANSPVDVFFFCAPEDSAFIGVIFLSQVITKTIDHTDPPQNQKS